MTIQVYSSPPTFLGSIDIHDADIKTHIGIIEEFCKSGMHIIIGGCLTDEDSFYFPHEPPDVQDSIVALLSIFKEKISAQCTKEPCIDFNAFEIEDSNPDEDIGFFHTDPKFALCPLAARSTDIITGSYSFANQFVDSSNGHTAISTNNADALPSNIMTIPFGHIYLLEADTLHRQELVQEKRNDIGQVRLFLSADIQ